MNGEAYDEELAAELADVEAEAAEDGGAGLAEEALAAAGGPVTAAGARRSGGTDALAERWQASRRARAHRATLVEVDTAAAGAGALAELAAASALLADLEASRSAAMHEALVGGASLGQVAEAMSADALDWQAPWEDGPLSALARRWHLWATQQRERLYARDVQQAEQLDRDYRAVVERIEPWLVCADWSPTATVRRGVAVEACRRCGQLQDEHYGQPGGAL